MQFDYRDVYKTLLQDWLGASDTILNTAMFGSYNIISSLIKPSHVVDPSCYIGVSQPLPVELAFFRAEVTDEDMVELRWETLNERDHDFFEVEKK